MRILPLGDTAVMVELGSKPDAATAAAVARLAQTLEENPLGGVTAIVPSFTTVTVHHGAGIAEIAARVEQWIRTSEAKPSRAARRAARTLTIPVCYGGKWGPDLAEVAQHAGMSSAQVVDLHKATTYDVRAIGFAPGFPYLGGLPGRLRVLRRKTPRTKVPAGSVGIGGAQTGVYPLETPGGWQLIGRTPLRLFRPEDSPPVLLRCGDRVRFQEIDADEFARRAAAEGVEYNASDGSDRDSVPAIAGPGMTVIKAGTLTTVQDLGRAGMQAFGVPEGGAMDRLAARLGNLLVGNDEAAAVIESTLRGPVLQFAIDVEIALTGARVAGLPWGRPFRVGAGEIISLETLEGGARVYLAVAGGFEAPMVLGGRSTYLRSGLPGFMGRALRAQDTLALGSARTASPSTRPGQWYVSTASFQPPGAAVRAVRGPHAEGFAPATWRTFESATYSLAAQSDRMGLRFQGPPLSREGGGEMVSQGVVAGTVQVPPDGQPIVLMADRQTIGGYAHLATVISVDLPKLAQLRPGADVRFEIITMDEARRLAVRREQEVARLRVALAERQR